MNPFYQFFIDLADACDMVFEQWPFLFYLVPVVLALNFIASLLRLLDLHTPAFDPQDYDSEIPPGPVCGPQYDPEHWYTGKD